MSIVTKHRSFINTQNNAQRTGEWTMADSCSNDVEPNQLFPIHSWQVTLCSEFLDQFALEVSTSTLHNNTTVQRSCIWGRHRRPAIPGANGCMYSSPGGRLTEAQPMTKGQGHSKNHVAPLPSHLTAGGVHKSIDTRPCIKNPSPPPDEWSRPWWCEVA